MLIGIGAKIRVKALKGVAKSTQITSPMPNTPPTISNTEIIRTQVFDIQPSFPADAIWRLTHGFMLPRHVRSVCLRAAFYMRHDPRSMFAAMRKAGSYLAAFQIARLSSLSVHY